MSQIDPDHVLWAISSGLPLSFLAYHVQRTRSRTRRIVFLADDLVTLLAVGDLARAASRIEEVCGSLGREEREFLHQLLREPRVGAGGAVWLADACAAIPSRAALLLAVVGAAIPVAYSASQIRFDSDPGGENDLQVIGAIFTIASLCGIALAVIGVVACLCYIVLPRYADACGRRIIHAVHEVQHAAERWLDTRQRVAPEPARNRFDDPEALR